VKPSLPLEDEPIIDRMASTAKSRMARDAGLATARDRDLDGEPGRRSAIVAYTEK
jgi:hypothetical protein